MQIKKIPPPLLNIIMHKCNLEVLGPVSLKFVRTIFALRIR